METAPLIIRPETVSDYPPIAALHARAFGGRAAESLIVTLHRQRRAFDPELSLVAEVDGQIAGHVLFSPHVIRLLDQNVAAVNLAPIAVDPAYQGRGIGGRLIAEGHTIAAAKGYAASILLGHTSYYPRFGYHTHAFGSAQLAVVPDTLPAEPLAMRGPTSEDIAALRDLWLHVEGSVDMALDPGADLLDWLSPNPAMRAVVYLRDDCVVGYTRIHDAETGAEAEVTKPRVFLARDAGAARAMIAMIAHQARQQGASAAECILPLHSASIPAAELGTAVCKAWASGMACSLAPSPLDEYLARVEAGERLPGRPIWPVAFDLA